MLLDSQLLKTQESSEVLVRYVSICLKSIYASFWEVIVDIFLLDYWWGSAGVRWLHLQVLTDYLGITYVLHHNPLVDFAMQRKIIRPTLLNFTWASNCFMGTSSINLSSGLVRKFFSPHRSVWPNLLHIAIYPTLQKLILEQ